MIKCYVCKMYFENSKYLKMIHDKMQPAYWKNLGKPFTINRWKVPNNLVLDFCSIYCSYEYKKNAK